MLGITFFSRMAARQGSQGTPPQPTYPGGASKVLE